MKEHKKLEKYQDLKEEMEKLWRVKVLVVSMNIRGIGAVKPTDPTTSKTTSKISV